MPAGTAGFVFPVVEAIGVTSNYELKQRCECHMVGQQAQHNRDAGEYQHDFLLAPAAHFKVVVDRRHLEQALAVGRLEVGDLQDNGQRF